MILLKCSNYDQYPDLWNILYIISKPRSSDIFQAFDYIEQVLMFWRGNLIDKPKLR